MVVADDKQAGAFGPGARDLKIRNLRVYPFANCLVFAVRSCMGEVCVTLLSKTVASFP